ncbi:3-dehydroquinate synthase [Meiothermus ruber]|jgi:3-dehydroquinate synthase|uniref:3-dehydroquinate synthase n=1 Tax=Meiothermus ruber (strain ATCC 35948 / DSM 1279 / VKM B-1258 / 21) TaxID=504728 RepID=D3PNU9_MEIRD|nr:3-dehydroquinate synthase family protein [Meiothermus ruber]ADD29494.1 3-dehydroquinate synthase [Meiothermus ruber DSM 1279]AGK05056.1 3-dehydroquinate synthase [Meiothermus ruber DSM 1279]MCL6529296.1 3-dehydroquinate synthase [Meiothermus ruber]
MQKLEIKHPVPYPIHLGFALELPQAPGPRALLYDLAVQDYAQQVAARLEIPFSLGLPGGEEAKSLHSYSRVLSWLAQQALPRNTTLYVVGGGCLTDLGGFVAATYLRGIRYISLPTTTLAMVDASVGNKTGLNLPEGKNLVGAFHAPAGVYAELSTLRTLPPQTFKEGLVEAFKHGLIAGDELLVDVAPISPDWEGLEPYLARAVMVKVRVVEADPTEQNERRKLNLGHTLGHALEGATHGAISHGVAVAYGLLYAALLGRAHGGADLVPTVLKLLQWLSPAPPPGLSWEDLTPFLSRDKKKVSQALHWVIPMGMGRLEIRPVPEEVLVGCYQEFLELLASLERSATKPL